MRGVAVKAVARCAVEAAARRASGAAADGFIVCDGEFLEIGAATRQQISLSRCVAAICAKSAKRERRG